MLGRTSFAQVARLRRIPRPLRVARLFSDDKGQNNVDNLIPNRPPNWLARKILESPKNHERFIKITNALGFGSPRSIAQTRTFVLYERVCSIKADEEKSFWRDGESLFCRRVAPCTYDLYQNALSPLLFNLGSL